VPVENDRLLLGSASLHFVFVRELCFSFSSSDAFSVLATSDVIGEFAILFQ
jgi:hypothetical protein